ncbi:MAG: hypothetical protein LBS21_15045 [Clostridiales bacterium]|nr:hypothetical protein [Clostridiales bacterium]
MSESLFGYSQLVAQIEEELGAGLPRDKAIGAAVDICITEGILVDFLRSNFQEVLKVLNFTYDAELDRRVQREENLEEGREEVFQVFRLRREGKSLSEIAQILNHPEKEIVGWVQALTL